MLGEKGTYKDLGIVEAYAKKQAEMKEKIKKDCLRRTKKLLKTKLCSKNLIKGINTWNVTLARYSGTFLKWTSEGFKQMDLRTRKIMIRHKALHPRDEVYRLYVSRKGEVEYLPGLKLALTNRTRGPKNDYNKKIKIGRKTFQTSKKQYLTRENTDGTKEENLKRESESLLIASQNNVIIPKHINTRIDKSRQNCKCTLCGDRDETINHIISECSKLVQKDYNGRKNGGWDYLQGVVQ